jgi:hypothetical protein
MTHGDDRRVQFDFEVDFSNGGGIQGQGRAARAGAAAPFPSRSSPTSSRASRAAPSTTRAIDNMTGGARPVHSVLLAAGIPICEHLTRLAALPVDGFRFTAAPVKVKGMGTFPVRAYATVSTG